PFAHPRALSKNCSLLLAFSPALAAPRHASPHCWLLCWRCRRGRGRSRSRQDKAPLHTTPRRAARVRGGACACNATWTLPTAPSA
ncbi:hypothetical protein COCVIDRAFT_114924, partial [Bipolaris victoriae FI3]